MSARLPILLKNNPYEVILGSGILSRTGEFAAQILKPGKCAIITDSNVAPLYGDLVKQSLSAAGFAPTLVTVPAGEKSKCLAEVERVCDALIEAGLDRGASVFALGGGVVGDLAGFVAAVYYRGIPYVQIPTTVVAQVDSAVGGKTGVNSQGGKNLIGAFHQPVLVVSDPTTLETLPKREFNEGLAEIIKHAVIRDAEMFYDFEFPPTDATDLGALVARNVKIKGQIVAEDEFERLGTRALLNFGHTIGHAIEAVAGYGRFLHGEAISIGIAAALALSVKKAGLPADHADKILRILYSCELPITLPAEISTEELITALKRDKKFEAGEIRFILTGKLGSAFVSKDISEEDIRSAIAGLRQP